MASNRSMIRSVEWSTVFWMDHDCYLWMNTGWNWFAMVSKTLVDDYSGFLYWMAPSGWEWLRVLSLLNAKLLVVHPNDDELAGWTWLSRSDDGFANPHWLLAVFRSAHSRWVLPCERFLGDSIRHGELQPCPWGHHSIRNAISIFRAQRPRIVKGWITSCSFNGLISSRVVN